MQDNKTQPQYFCQNCAHTFNVPQAEAYTFENMTIVPDAPEKCCPHCGSSILVSIKNHPAKMLEWLTATSKRCMDCAYYKPYEEDVSVGCCAKEYWQYDEDMPRNTMTTECSNDGGVIVGCEFGCIHFEAKVN